MFKVLYKLTLSTNGPRIVTRTGLVRPPTTFPRPKLTVSLLITLEYTQDYAVLP